MRGMKWTHHGEEKTNRHGNNTFAIHALLCYFHLKGAELMPYILPDLIAQVKQIDLLTYLQTYDPDELVSVGGNEYCTKSHDSLRISNNLWCWHSRGIGGKSALDYLIKVCFLLYG